MGFSTNTPVPHHSLHLERPIDFATEGLLLAHRGRKCESGLKRIGGKVGAGSDTKALKNPTTSVVLIADQRLG
jgi:hypothetical protein